MKAVRQTGCPVSASEARASLKHTPGSAAFMSGHVPLANVSLASVDAFDKARELVQLTQCPLCSRPLEPPVVTLPCGSSVCRSCLPESHQRQLISYPNTPDRQRGIRCPVPGCGLEHAVGECSNDVCLSKLMETMRSAIASWKQTDRNFPVQVIECCDTPTDAQLSEKPLDEPRSLTSNGGSLAGIFDFAEAGSLLYHSDCRVDLLTGTEADCRVLDRDLLAYLNENTHKELECRVCYYIMYDPVTTPCGHTFCRQCLVRVLDHSTDCPMCRQILPIPLSLKDHSSNKRLVALLDGLYSDQVLAREQAIHAEERGVGDLDTAIFVCALAFPGMPTYLHIFEPRYRLMMRRALDSNRQFGMVMYNRTGTSQGELGASRFTQYGTMLTITNYRMLPDGRSLIETRGAFRFRVKSSASLDGYTVGSVERVEDMSLAEEERLEAEDLRASNQHLNSVADPAHQLPSSPTRSAEQQSINGMSTTELWQTGIDFVTRMQSNSAPWLHQRILDAYGGPPTDPATFPYWFACILPIADDEKYQLLHITSVRERLKVVVGWIRRVENQRW